jgi:hypothetical protein
VLAIYPISTGYEILGPLHILTAVVAFGPVFAYPAMHRAGAAAEMAKMHMRVTLPSLFLLWVFGMGLAGMSDDTFKVSQTWLVLAIVDWVILMVGSWFLIRPANTDAGDDGRKKLAMGTGITHLGLVVGLVLMIWKPGSPL